MKLDRLLGILIILSGLLLVITASVLYKLKSIRAMEEVHDVLQID